MKKLKLGIVGSGFLGGIVADAWKDGFLDEYELVGIAGRNQGKTEALAKRVGTRPCKDADELLSLHPDYIAEAASVQAVKDIAGNILSSGCGLVVISIGAFAEVEFYEKISGIARENGTKIYIASGAVGGFDVLRTICLMGSASTDFVSKKGPRSLQNTPLFEDHLLTDSESTIVFHGNAKEAIGLLPTKVNVAVAASRAANGPENLQVSIHSVPGMVGDDYVITAEAKEVGVKAIVNIYSKTSAIAGWSIVSVLQNIVSPIVF